MILVTVGTHDQGFERLVRAADSLAGLLEEPVVIQYGASRYIPQKAEAFAWASSEKMLELTFQSHVVISHAAAGASILALKERKPLVLVPRRKTFGENYDDHQLELAGALAQAGQAVVVDEPTPESLVEAIARAQTLVHRQVSSSTLICALKDQLKAWGKPERAP